MTTERIRELNDQFRKTFSGGKIVMTAAISAAYDYPTMQQIVKLIQDCEKFDNDCPEHDMGAVTFEGRTIWFKIDYYDKSMEYGSEDPSNPEQTTRVLTILFPEDY